MIRVFVDSDVIISSLLSSQGAAYLLLHHPQVVPVISSFSKGEIEIVVTRLNLRDTMWRTLLKDRLELIEMSEKLNVIKNIYRDYAWDIDDIHIVAGAHRADVTYLISYNIRHYKIELIKRDFGILLMTPGMFLQYLRSK